MSEQGRSLAEILAPLMEEVARRQADNELNSAWTRFKKVTGRLFDMRLQGLSNSLSSRIDTRSKSGKR